MLSAVDWLISDHKRDGGAIWPPAARRQGPSVARTADPARGPSTSDLLTLVNVRPGVQGADLLVAVAGDLEREVAALALGQRSQRAERFESSDSVVERPRICDQLLPVVLVDVEALEVRARRSMAARR